MIETWYRHVFALAINRSWRSQIFFKKGVLEDFGNFQGKWLCWSLFLINLQAWRWSKQVFFCKIPEILNWRTPLVVASEQIILSKSLWFYEKQSPTDVLKIAGPKILQFSQKKPVLESLFCEIASRITGPGKIILENHLPRSISLRRR